MKSCNRFGSFNASCRVRVFTISILLAIAITMPASAAADAFQSWSGTAWVRASDSSGDHYQYASGTYYDGDDHIFDINSGGNWGYSTASTSGFAGFGALKGFVSGSSTGGFGTATLQLIANDLLTVSVAPGSSLHMGDPVDLQFRFTLYDHLYALGAGCPGKGCDSAIAYFNGSSITDDNRGFQGLTERTISGHTTWIVHTTVGAQLPINTELDLGTFSGAGGCDPSVDICPLVNTYVDTSHTALFYVDPLTAGATYTTESGSMYLSPAPTSSVPEPASIYLLLAGGIGALFKFRRS